MNFKLKQLSETLWDEIKANLKDRSLFNDTDDETEAEIDDEQVKLILEKLGELPIA